MTTYEITIDDNNISGKHFLKYVKTLPFVSISRPKAKKMNGLDEALEDIREGRISEPMNIEEFKKYTQKIWDKA
ncbi:MAG: hypothetical protein FWG85_03510 [Bacteroidetes bacterium]|nr:hypothetical protein [Bacteroidota bacterium]